MRLVYLSYLEPISGVYEGQVIDVCRYLEAVFEVPVTLIAVFSCRNFSDQKAKLLDCRRDSKAVRSLLGWRAWSIARRMVSSQIAAALPPETKAIVARGPIAASLAISLRDQGKIVNVAYDGRGATAAEWREYNVAPFDVWRSRMMALERNAVLEADVRIAVSNALVRHWQEAFGYSGSDHTVIPCTLSAHQERALPDVAETEKRRRELGFMPNQIVICYAGSAAEWQSITKLDSWLDRLMTRDPRIAILMLTRADLSQSRIVANHQDRIFQTWVSPDRVKCFMEACDYGILVREASVTNQVAAPTKFAEYLAAGLSMLISPHLGDYSELVQAKDLGQVCDLAAEPPALVPQSLAHKAARARFAIATFSKSSFADAYQKVLRGLEITT